VVSILERRIYSCASVVLLLAYLPVSPICCVQPQIVPVKLSKDCTRVLLRVVNSKFQFRTIKSSETQSHRDTSYRTQRNSNNIKHKRMSKAKLEMDKSLIAREHQEARDEALAPMKNMILLTSVVCVRDSWWEQQWKWQKYG
jgi:hypothetical protein